MTKECICCHEKMKMQENDIYECYNCDENYGTNLCRCRRKRRGIKDLNSKTIAEYDEEVKEKILKHKIRGKRKRK
jgi:hypothetical protein